MLGKLNKPSIFISIFELFFSSNVKIEVGISLILCSIKKLFFKK